MAAPWLPCACTEKNILLCRCAAGALFVVRLVASFAFCHAVCWTVFSVEAVYSCLHLVLREQGWLCRALHVLASCGSQVSARCFALCRLQHMSSRLCHVLLAIMLPSSLNRLMVSVCMHAVQLQAGHCARVLTWLLIGPSSNLRTSRTQGCFLWLASWPLYHTSLCTALQGLGLSGRERL